MKLEKIEDVIGLWPSMGVLSRDIDIGYEKVKKWKRYKSIPAKYWQRLILAAANRGYALSCHDLVRIVAVENQ